jgi:23S rRNA (adenine2030-N6)-methyltransferase
LNYRHAFHAGNFADLVKHAALLELLAELASRPGPLTIIDTHAGRGLYDLAGPEARRSGEAQAGVVRLMAAMDAPQAFGPLKAAVKALNRGDEVLRYPGSPWLIAAALRPGDRYLACELQAAEHAALATTLRGRAGARALCADGYRVAARETPARGEVLVVIDPPFEQADDYARIAGTVAAVRRRNPRATPMAWLPLKDLATFDGFLGELGDAARAPILVAEARIAPLTDPMRMNGCALAVVGAPPGLSNALEAICGWVAAALGRGGGARVYQA